MDHFCGDPVFCWVYHEVNKVFTPWGPNSEILLSSLTYKRRPGGVKERERGEKKDEGTERAEKGRGLLG